ncbi:MAG: CPBP family intramembrane metalloprotease [Planctomycetes bacterium]|nr:CPBP family intramembrane metalloprotease [Planctomycetota bacterium]
MNHRPPGTARVLWLLATNSVRRILRGAQVMKARRLNLMAAAGKPVPRQPTARKRSDGLLWLAVVMLPIFLFQSILISGQAVGRLHDAAEATAATAAAAADPEPAATGMAPREKVPQRYVHSLLAVRAQWHEPEARGVFTRCGAVLVLALTAMLLVMGIGGGNTGLAGGEWTQAWLLTFPVPTRSLVLARVLEYGLVALFPWLVLFPLQWQLLRTLDVRGAIWVAMLTTLATTMLAAAVRLWCETRLRLSCSLHRLRSVQGACTLVSMLLMSVAFMVCLGTTVPQWFLALGCALPDWITLLPGSWSLALGTHGATAALVGCGATVLAVVAAVAGCTSLLRGGAMRSGGVDPGARGRQGAWKRGRRLGIAGKELALLLRDRNFLVQTLVVPLFVIGLQFIVNPNLGSATGRNLTLLAYGVASYSLIGGCFQVLSGEGRSIWILFAQPTPIESVLRQKTRLWATHGIVIGLGALLAFSARGGFENVVALAFDCAAVAIGSWCAAHLAAGIGVIGCNPAADHVPRQMKVRHVYLYMFFASTFVVALASTDWQARVGGVLVFGTLTFAVWQRACDRLPSLLDPVDEHRDHVGVYDGAAALVVFNLIQGLVLAILLRSFTVGAAPMTQVFVAFAIGGALTLLVFVPILRGRDVALGRALGMSFTDAQRPLLASVAAIGLGVGAGMLGLGYLALNARHGWFEVPPLESDNPLGLMLLAVVAAPVIEELLFRGLLLEGLRRGTGPVLGALWSAALFTVMHPLVSWAPVFVLGLLTAFVQLRTRFLPAAMLLHAVYNFVVVTYR